MPLLTKDEFELYQSLISLNQDEIKKVMHGYLSNIYKEIISNDDFIYAVGDIPIALVSHMDTVFEEKDADREFMYNNKRYLRPKRKPEVFYDQWKEIMACPTGAGFDDRAGIYAIVKIVESGLRPSIILTTDEEIGGVGATKLVNRLKNPLSDLRYIIQLDRRGTEDSVFYDLEYPEFEEYVNSFGFKTNIGSFSDISTICPAWNVAGVNLSIGYFNEHSVEEVLDVAAWLDTIEKVKHMLTDKDKRSFEYKESALMTKLYPYAYYDEWDTYYDEKVKCKCCGKEYDIFSLEPLLNKEGKTEYYCYTCLPYIDKCSECEDYFFKKKKSWKYCKKCSKEMSLFGKRKRKDNK